MEILRTFLTELISKPKHYIFRKFNKTFYCIAGQRNALISYTTTHTTYRDRGYFQLA